MKKLAKCMRLPYALICSAKRKEPHKRDLQKKRTPQKRPTKRLELQTPSPAHERPSKKTYKIDLEIDPQNRPTKDHFQISSL